MSSTNCGKCGGPFLKIGELISGGPIYKCQYCYGELEGKLKKMRNLTSYELKDAVVQAATRYVAGLVWNGEERIASVDLSELETAIKNYQSEEPIPC